MNEALRRLQLNWWAPSRQLAVFWIALLCGVVLAQWYQLPLAASTWICGIWLVIFLSGQKPIIELTALTVVGFVAGGALWQLTNGEAWLKIGFVSSGAEQLTTIRDHLVDRILVALPEPHGSLLAGILFGNRVKLDPELIEEFRAVGLSHIIAVSGYNLTILTANLRTALRPYFGRQIFWVGLAIVALFIALTGAPSSILRAGTMISILLLAEYLGRPTRPLLILLNAAGLLVVFEPKILFDVGFQLSIAATYGLLRVAPLIARPLQEKGVPKTAAIIIAETVGATIATAPIILVVFEHISLVSLASNLAVVWLIPLVMTLGIIGVTLSLILPAVGAATLLLCWPILQWVLRVSEYLASLSFASATLALHPAALIATVVGLYVGCEIWHLTRSETSDAYRV